ncbi:acetate/propionate family kinase [Methylobacillus arboreus]|uniref:acetate/propionate family kinase n=1 Tax=Methylobacillus arboreus TaxID=755170 RepID=UPI001E5200AB|nr:acetate/propionate family kinase [Methylobacillus arboreus]MCB5191567.1 acetate/propionate family kinase [Methylobacillus arboreus]
MSKLVLVLNCGSSSIKFGLFDISKAEIPRKPRWNGKVDGILGSNPTYGDSLTEPHPIALGSEHPYSDALRQIIDQTQQQLHGGTLVAIAHRVVHGGSQYFKPVRVDAEVLRDLRSYIPLAPLHQPFALEAIERLLRFDPALPQVACFDTAFHHTLPEVEQVLPLPYAAFERGIRRYGFHGLSYEYMALHLPELFGEQAKGRTIVAHLGSGASLCGMQGLQSVATTMSFSALDGLMMGTRCGALDPGVLLHMMEVEHLSPARVGEMLYHESGLLGVSGISSDPRVLLQREADEPRARLALDLYVRRIVREIGSLVAVLGGLELLVFTAGIGEHNADIRQRVIQGLGFLGLKLDEAANQAHARVISLAESQVMAAVAFTNEEWMAAHHTQALLQAKQDGL